MNSQNSASKTAGSFDDRFPSPPRAAEVPEQICSLTCAIERLAKATANLVQKLHPVMRESGKGEKTDGQPVPSLCELADQIRNRVDQVHYEASVIEMLAEVVQL